MLYIFAFLGGFFLHLFLSSEGGKAAYFGFARIHPSDILVSCESIQVILRYFSEIRKWEKWGKWGGRKNMI